jgi:hypothetical protein
MDRSFATAGGLGALLLLIGLAIGLWWAGHGTGPPGVAYATISITCGSQTLTLSTGNSKGECKNGTPPQPPCAPTVRVMRPGLHAKAARRHRGQVAALRRASFGRP